MGSSVKREPTSFGFHRFFCEWHISSTYVGPNSSTLVFTCRHLVFGCKRPAYYFQCSRRGDSILAKTNDLLQVLETMRENLRETLKETSALRSVAIEEETLSGVESIDKTCNNALRSIRRLEILIKPNASYRHT